MGTEVAGLYSHDEEYLSSEYVLGMRSARGLSNLWCAGQECWIMVFLSIKTYGRQAKANLTKFSVVVYNTMYHHTIQSLHYSYKAFAICFSRLMSSSLTYFWIIYTITTC